MNNAILSAKKLNKEILSNGATQKILSNLDIEIEDGGFTVIMGPSGAGKSTLLYILSGMDKPSSGDVVFNNCEITKYKSDKIARFRRKNCGFVFQQGYLLDNMSLMDNALASGFLVAKKKKDIVSKASKLFERVGISEKVYSKFPAQVSGGELQRAAIVRALINDPTIVFADEPTGALNSSAGVAVLDNLTELNQGGQSIVMVTHDIKSALRGDKILYIKDGVICGVLELGKYNSSDDNSRLSLLRSFLDEMGW